MNNTNKNIFLFSGSLFSSKIGLVYIRERILYFKRIIITAELPITR